MSKNLLGSIFRGIEEIEKSKSAVALRDMAGKNNKITTLAILLFITGCFFYAQNHQFMFGLRAVANEEDRNLKTESMDENFYSKISLEYDKDLSSEDDSIKMSKELDLEGIALEDVLRKKLEAKLHNMVSGDPIEEMVPYIAEHNPNVAAFIVGIARKESSWGLHAPSKNGETCYNYWGYKGSASRGSSLGYACFEGPEEAINIVGGRIQRLVDQGLDTPSRLVVWKCGSSCAATGGQAAANKWISDVNIYYQEIMSWS